MHHRSIYKSPVFIIVIGLIVYYIPFIILGENSYIRVHDILDDIVAHTKMTVESNTCLGGNIILPIMYGIPVSDFSSSSSSILIHTLLYNLFPTFYAYIINDCLVRVFAAFGLYQLLYSHILGENEKYRKTISLVCALIYCYVPFYTVYGISAAGIPLVFYAFTNLYKRNKINISYAIVILYGLYSSFVLSGIFVCIVAFVCLCYIYFYKKNSAPHLFGAFIYLCLYYIIVNTNTIYNFINPNALSHRVEFLYDVKDAMASLFQLCFETQYHSGAINTLPIVLCLVINVFYTKYVSRRHKVVIGFIAIIMFWCCVFYLIRDYSNLSILKSFQFDRIYWFLPSLWMILFAISINDLLNRGKTTISVMLSLILFLSVIRNNYEYRSTLMHLMGKNIKSPTFKQFYDVKLYADISKNLGIKDNRECKVVSLGMYPAIAEYNGYHTVDGYVANYALIYKHKFRKVISEELKKSKDLANYFDRWGNRCYIFSSELGKQYLYGKNSSKRYVENLQINIEALKTLGCDYIFSAVKINNADQLKIKYISRYTTPDSFWEIYVYKV